MFVALSSAIGVGVASAGSLLAYGVAIVQVRRRYPDRWKAFAIQCLATGATGTTVGLLRDFEPLFLASIPMMLLVVALVAGKGSVAVLVGESETETDMPKATRDARNRLTALLVALFVIGAVLYAVFGDY